jgi:hypothetical protein
VNSLRVAAHTFGPREKTIGQNLPHPVSFAVHFAAKADEPGHDPAKIARYFQWMQNRVAIQPFHNDWRKSWTKRR